MLPDEVRFHDVRDEFDGVVLRDEKSGSVELEGATPRRTFRTGNEPDARARTGRLPIVSSISVRSSAINRWSACAEVTDWRAAAVSATARSSALRRSSRTSAEMTPLRCNS